MKINLKKLAAATVASVALVATVAESSSSGDGDTVVETTDSTADESSTEETSEETESDSEGESESGSGALGTRQNPAPLGTIVRVGDWELMVTEVDTNANKIVAQENQFNDKPKSGYNFVLWAVEATYVGEDSATLWIDTSWKVLGADGNTFDDSCGVIPDNLSDEGETFNGAKVSGNECVPVEKSQIPGAAIIVEASFSFDDDRTFFAIP